jgi:hypothetical protein
MQPITNKTRLRLRLKFKVKQYPSGQFMKILKQFMLNLFQHLLDPDSEMNFKFGRIYSKS